MNGGILEVLGSKEDARVFMHRFFRGGGHFFWRFLRLSVMAFVGGAIVAGVVAAVPEPVGLGAIALAAVALVVHRRTRR